MSGGVPILRLATLEDIERSAQLLHQLGLALIQDEGVLAPRQRRKSEHRPRNAYRTFPDGPRALFH